ncbi:MAG: acetyl-CoA carboxylase carboxyltransferase subunit alpha [Planctomycetota bacterium]|jgi:acetyl-CoA carboxylase carboxyl transferase subunit alpha
MSESNYVMDFEAPLEDIRTRVQELRKTAELSNIDIDHEIEAMEEQHLSMARQVYANLTAWQEVQMARHPARPQTRDYIRTAFSEFVEIHGDRVYGDDGAIVTGFGKIGNHRVLMVGEHKGRTVEERHVCYAGCPHAEGYRKALNKMQLAEKFGIPIVTFVDTKGAYPGTGSEERGVGPAIALNLREMSNFKVPIIVVIIGEGGSGGALGIGIGDRILMLQHAYYSVISPEGCAAILWRDGSKAPEAAAALKLTSRDHVKNGLVDEVIIEPIGGAHRDPGTMGKLVAKAIIKNLDELVKIPTDKLLEERYEKIRAMGEFEEASESQLMEMLGLEPVEEAEGEAAATS